MAEFGLGVEIVQATVAFARRMGNRTLDMHDMDTFVRDNSVRQNTGSIE